MSSFEQVAIVGTGQVPPTEAERVASPGDMLLNQLDSEAGFDRERVYLLRAGIRAVLKRAALEREIDVMPVDPAPPDPIAPCTERLANIVAALLMEQEAELLIEACEVLAARGRRFTEELLPSALEQTNSALRTALVLVLGERGRWLARLRPEWGWALLAGAEQDPVPRDWQTQWEEGTAAERRSLLRLMLTHMPDQARQLVNAAWTQEKSEQRLAWLEDLAPKLTRGDEPFLTEALGDRSAPVRAAAARLLGRLPESDVAQRIRQRALSLVRMGEVTSAAVAPSRFAREHSASALAVQLPPEPLDPELEHLGVAANPPPHIGKRQWWLSQMVSALPPALWTQHLGGDPRQIVAEAATNEFAHALLDGFTSAAVRFDAQSWFAPLYDAWADRNLPPSGLTTNPIAVLGRRLTKQDAEPRMLALLDSDRASLLTVFPRPWPAGVARKFLAELTKYRPGWASLLGSAALAIPVQLLPEVVPVPETLDDVYAGSYLRALDRFQIVAQTRRAIHEEPSP